MKQILPVVTILTLLTFIGTNNGFCEYSTLPIQYVPKDGNLVIEYYNEPINKIDLYRILSDTPNKEITLYAKRAKRLPIVTPGARMLSNSNVNWRVPSCRTNVSPSSRLWPGCANKVTALSESRSLSAVKGEDKCRKNIYQKLGKTDYDNPFLYHLVLKMSKVSLEQTLKLVCKLVDPGKY